MDTQNLHIRVAFEQSLAYARDLNKTLHELRETHRELHESYLDTVHRLAVAAEYRDGDTGGHIMRMGVISAFLAEKIGFDNDEAEIVRHAAPMHDIGKIAIPDCILLKPGKLTSLEWETIKTHCAIGARMLSGSKSKILQYAEVIALTHHERWNGDGYPRGLVKDEIPLIGRLISLVDVYDALTSKRPYKPAYDPETAVEMIIQERGKQFDPEIVDVFVDNFDDLCQLHDSAG